MRRKIQYYLIHFAVFAIQVCIGVLCGWLMSLWALPYAYNFRGYYAIGTEWVLILGCGVLGCVVTHKSLVHILTN
jgi:hypothetical protein